MWVYGRGETDTQTRVTAIHFASSIYDSRAKRNEWYDYGESVNRGAVVVRRSGSDRVDDTVGVGSATVGIAGYGRPWAIRRRGTDTAARERRLLIRRRSGR